MKSICCIYNTEAELSCLPHICLDIHNDRTKWYIQYHLILIKNMKCAIGVTFYICYKLQALCVFTEILAWVMTRTFLDFLFKINYLSQQFSDIPTILAEHLPGSFLKIISDKQNCRITLNDSSKTGISSSLRFLSIFSFLLTGFSNLRMN